MRKRAHTLKRCIRFVNCITEKVISKLNKSEFYYVNVKKMNLLQRQQQESLTGKRNLSEDLRSELAEAGVCGRRPV